MGINLPETYLSFGHFETPEKNSNVIKEVEQGNTYEFRCYRKGKFIGKYMIDGSGGKVKCEADNPKWIMDYLKAPFHENRIKELEEENKRLRKRNDALVRKRR